MTTYPPLDQQLGTSLLVEDARTLSTAAGPCALCQYALLAADRAARLVPGGWIAHLSCIARAALRPQPLTRIRTGSVIR
ncbi:hypothetical protein [Trebonia sp.]|uniref:hypothetical protein n=1 Tax=Trebonia sp. TaxID=2767075 RepID=UPI00263523A2|nr:hypothetical protein [Trebonia sp.]